MYKDANGGRFMIIDLLSDDAVFFGSETQCNARVTGWNDRAGYERFVTAHATQYAIAG